MMCRLVICDDEKTIRNGMKHLIDGSGTKLKVEGMASNGFEAFNLISEIKPDVVLMDINMPGISGLEVIEKSSVISPFTKYIIISGYDEFEYVRKALKLKAFDYLLKPVDKNNLFAVIENACNACNLEKIALSASKPDEKRTVADEAIQYIYRNYGIPELSLSSLAKNLHISESYLTRVIKKEADMSFSELITKVRIESAINLLITNPSMSHQAIAEKVGFKSQHYFSKVFKSYTGLSPSEYKSKHHSN